MNITRTGNRLRAALAVSAITLLLAGCGEIDLRKPRKPDPGPPPQTIELDSAPSAVRPR
jgi:hypothetical protein